MEGVTFSQASCTFTIIYIQQAKHTHMYAAVFRADRGFPVPRVLRRTCLAAYSRSPARASESLKFLRVTCGGKKVRSLLQVHAGNARQNSARLRRNGWKYLPYCTYQNSNLSVTRMYLNSYQRFCPSRIRCG